MLKWWIYIGMLSTLGTLFSNIVDGIGMGGFQNTNLGIVLSSMGMVHIATEMGTVTGAAADKDLWSAVWGMLSWDYAFLQGSLFVFFPLELIRFLLFGLTFAIMIEVMLILMSLVRGILPR